jgi:hypothetical protein
LRGGLRKIFKRIFHLFQNRFTSFDPMTRCQVLGVIVGQPYLPAFILPDERFLPKVYRRGLTALHQERSDFWIAETQEIGILADL